jgi:NAD(P)-dependent dehydrogenase (short-subunit alcohol dehydrogenase family)
MNKTVLITGSSKRIGGAIAAKFALSSWNVIIHYNKSKRDALNLFKKLNNHDSRIEVLKADLCDARQRKNLLRDAFKLFNHIDLLINNASYFKYDDALDINNKIWDRAIETNLKAPIDLSTHYYKSIKKKGCIINIIDNKILNLNPDFFSYTVSKFGLEGATKLLAMKFAPKIRVFGIAPGITLQSGDQTTLNFKKVHNKNPLNSGATPEEIADTCIFFEKVKSITGFTIPIDGGHSMYNYGKDIQYT